jgi:branched-chain amino acid transport system substrate-binding protein
MFYRLVVSVLFCFGCIAVHAQPKEQRVALVIGNSSYKSSPLKNPVNDARDMANSLRGYGFTVIERTNLTTRQVGQTLREFRSKLTPGSVAVVFYAGHGVQIKGENYLPTVDAEINGEEDVPMQSLSTRQVMDILSEAKTRMNLVFLDACRDNPYARSFRSGSRGIAKENAPSGTLISFATRPGSVAGDGDGRNGLYTSVLLEQIKQSNQPIEQVLKRVVSGVKVASKGQQEPWMEGSIEGDFCFGQCGLTNQPTGVSNNVSRAEQKDPEEESWGVASRLNQQYAYQEYLNSYPAGRYKAAAQMALASFNQPTQNSQKLQSPTPIPLGTRIIKIGHVAPLSGAIAHLGRDNENGARLAIEQLNNEKTVIGGQLVKFELVTDDDAADPRRAVQSAHNLVSQGVVSVVGHLNSGATIPAAAVYSNAGIVQISPSATNPKYTRLGYSTAFRLVGDDVKLGEVMAKVVGDKFRPARVLVVDDRTAYGAGIADVFAGVLSGNKNTSVQREFTNDRGLNLDQLVSNAIGFNPDVVFFGGMDAVAAPLYNKLRSSGLTFKFVGGDGICTNELSKLLGSGLLNDDVLCAESGGVTSAEISRLQEFQSQFRSRFGEDVKLYAPYTYDAVKLLAAAIKATASTSSTEISNYLKKSKYKGVTGPLDFDQKGDLNHPAFTVYTFREGKRVLVGVVRP